MGAYDIMDYYNNTPQERKTWREVVVYVTMRKKVMVGVDATFETDEDGEEHVSECAPVTEADIREQVIFPEAEDGWEMVEVADWDEE